MGESTEQTGTVSGEDRRSDLTRRKAVITAAGVAATAAGVTSQVPRWVEDETAEREPSADRLFDANITERGLSGYATLIPEDNREGLGYHVVPDPVGGGRHVPRLTSLPESTLGNEFPVPWWRPSPSSRRPRTVTAITCTPTGIPMAGRCSAWGTSPGCWVPRLGYPPDNGWASFSRIGVYGNKSHEAFFATHRVARTFDAADPLH